MKWADVIGLLAQSGEFKLRYEDVERDLDFAEMVQATQIIEAHTLIARPISDMSEDELIEAENLEIEYDWDIDIFHDGLTRLPEWDCCYLELFLYLISIGVWAWDKENVEFRNKDE